MDLLETLDAEMKRVSAGIGEPSLLSMRVCGILVCAAAWLQLLGSAAHSFEADGLKSGMSEAEALQVFASFGDYQKSPAGQKGGWMYLSKPPSIFRVISTCGGKLATYQFEVPGGWHAFMRMVERESREKGAGTYSMSSSETTLGPGNTLNLEWALPGGEKLSISYGQTGDQPPNVMRVLMSKNACGL